MVTFVQSYSYNRPFDDSHNVEVAFSENEFDTPDLEYDLCMKMSRNLADFLSYQLGYSWTSKKWYFLTSGLK